MTALTDANRGSRARRIAKLSAAAPLSVEALKFARHSVTARNLAVAHALKAEGHGIAVPRKMTRRAKAYVDHKIRKADRRAAPPR